MWEVLRFVHLPESILLHLQVFGAVISGVSLPVDKPLDRIFVLFMCTVNWVTVFLASAIAV